MLELNKIYCGNCLDVMQDIDSNSVDCIVTDPPYQLSSPNIKNVTKGFMGKSWDICPSIEIWQESLRVLKPGAFAFVMCIPRQDCLARMICRLEDAGFNISFSSVLHTFASGFPKAASLSKQADKRAGAEREVIGKRASAGGRSGNTSGLGDIINKMEKEFDVTLPATPQAKALDGAYSGFQPKPAVEIVIVAMKPLEEKTYVDQALKNGHGCTWLDDCRIPYAGEENVETVTKKPSKLKKNAISYVRHDEPLYGGTGHQNGRFPANVLCEDDVLDDGYTRKSGNVNPHSQKKSLFCSCNKCTSSTVGDTGAYSRYFSLDAWFAERIKQLPKEAQKTFPWLIVPKASKGEKNRGLENMEPKQVNDGRNELPDNAFQRGIIYRTNTHSTVKPLKLMSWLITLASREGDTILDPFCGSGTTPIAAKMLGRQYIGIDKEEEYCEIARKRISAIHQQLDSYNML